MSEEKLKEPKKLSRREFLKDAGIVVGGTAVGSAFFLSACGEEIEVTKTVTTTAPGTTSTVTTTAPGGTTTQTQTQTITKFTCPVCNQEFDSLATLKAHFDTEHDFSEMSAVKSWINFTVDGKKYDVQVEPNLTLERVLHDKLGVIGIKTFCKRGACGSCTVIMNGRPILSCMTLAIECDGKVIETSEGIAENEHPLIDAYIKYHCMQCGYCTPGFVVTAKALLDRNPNPTEEEIKEALAGNLCRCSTYPQHPIAIHEAASVLRGGA